MQTKRFWRSLVSYGTFAALLFQALGVVNPASARAATPYLRISEIHWAGSTGTPSDQWIELKNVSGAPIDFSVTPFSLEADTGTGYEVIAKLTTGDGVLPADAHAVITRENIASLASTLSGTGNAVYYERPTLVLPSSATSYRLMESGVNLEDHVADPDGAGPLTAPFAGSQVGTMASMSRVDVLADGDLQANWYTATTQGVNFVADTHQYGTPGEDNVEVAAPSMVHITPHYSIEHGTTPQVMGKATGAAMVHVTFTRVSFSGPTLQFGYNAPVVGDTFTLDVPGLDVARYAITAYARNAAGDMSMSVAVPAMPDTTDYDYVVVPTVSSVPTPVLATYPEITNQGTVTFSGTVDTTAHTYDSVEILANGMYLTTVPVVGTSFTASVPLTPNDLTYIEFYAVDSTTLWSMPAEAVVLHDSVAPTIDAQKVQLVGNIPGSVDTIKGLAGASEADAILTIYGDAAKTIVLANLTVAADGSFPITGIGDNKYASVYLVAKDEAGNVSETVKVDNPISFGSTSGKINPQVSSISETTATVTWSAIAGATSYRLKYKGVGGDYSSPIALCVTGTCSYQTTLINLNASTQYVVAIAAVDAYGNESAYVESSVFTTLTPTPVIAPEPVVTEVVATKTTPRKTDSVTKTDTTPAPESTDKEEDKGDVKSAATETSRNWTPWIILGVLVGIAVLATAGYFYWFGGEAGEMAMMGMAGKGKEEEPDTSAKKSSTGGSSGTNSPPPVAKAPNNKDKRW